MQKLIEHRCAEVEKRLTDRVIDLAQQAAASAQDVRMACMSLVCEGANLFAAHAAEDAVTAADKLASFVLNGKAKPEEKSNG
jgi:hypothetical protein